jgi:hypothetical protein
VNSRLPTTTNAHYYNSPQNNPPVAAFQLHDTVIMRIATRLVSLSLLCTVSAASTFAGFITNHAKFRVVIEKSGPKIGILQITSCQGDLSSPGEEHQVQQLNSRRSFMASLSSFGLMSLCGMPIKSGAEEAAAPIVAATGDVKKLFTEGRALEAQGNILAAQRLYTKITKVSPGFIYGWSSLGNTLTAQGDLNTADEAYTKAISLCEENLRFVENNPGTRRCDDLYLLLLNRGSVRLNDDRAQDALVDLQRSNALRARPDAIVLQNLARAQGEPFM